MVIYSLLKHNHEIINNLLQKISSLDKEDSFEKYYYFYECKKEIIVHIKTAEQIFYYFIKKYTSIGSILHHVEDISQEVISMLTSLNKNFDDKAEWHQLFNQLAISYMHYSEEESSIINLATEILTPEEAQLLGEIMQQQKQIEEKFFYISIKAEAKLNGVIILE